MSTEEGRNLVITFCSGAGTVTGANFLVQAGKTKFLVDCGLIQNTSIADPVNWQPWPYDAKEIDALIITHSHIDHIGRIPKLINDGFRGRIISTIPTKELVRPMLEDTAAILGHEKELHLSDMYNAKNIDIALSLWEGFRTNGRRWKCTSPISDPIWTTSTTPVESPTFGRCLQRWESDFRKNAQGRAYFHLTAVTTWVIIPTAVRGVPLLRGF
jgi:hypothetical protein